jgi:AIPR protein
MLGPVATDDDELRAIAAAYAEKYGFKRDSLDKGLEGFAVHLFAQENGLDDVLDGSPTEDAELGDYILRGDDLGVDGVLIDDAAPRVVLIQSTWRSNERGMEEKLNSFAGILPRLLDAEYVAQGGAKAKNLLGALRQQIKDGYSIELRFVTNVKTGQNDRLRNAVRAANRTFESDTAKTVRMTLYGGAELLRTKFELTAANIGKTVGQVEFYIERGNIVEWDGATGGRKTLIGAIKGNQLLNLYGRYRNELFAVNIRLPLETGRVNPEIIKTAKEHPQNFFYYNNGISAVCKSIVVDDTHVIADNFQIINGAQTVHAVVTALEDSPQRELYVLFRLTETDEGYGGTFTENMVKYNNTQNPVKVSDFVSNDPIQLWLTKELTALSGKGPLHSFYYVHKSGYSPKKTQGLRKLNIDDFARTRHAYLYGPTVSYREPGTFFDKQGRYKEAFGVDGTIVSTWEPETLYEAAVAVAINERVRAIAKRMKQTEKAKALPETRYLYRLSRYITALVGVALKETKDDSFKEYAALVFAAAQFDAIVRPYIKTARGHILREMVSRSATSVQPEYNFARDDVAWNDMKTLMLSSIAGEELLDDF